LRIDNAKEFTSQEMNFCSKKDIILQPVVDHTMQCRVEGGIDCSKQHSRVALVCANAPTCLKPDATVDFTCKKNTLWTKRDKSIANDRMQPAFAGSYKTVAIPFALM